MWIAEPISPRRHYPLPRLVKLHLDTDAVARLVEDGTPCDDNIGPLVKMLPAFRSRKKTFIFFNTSWFMYHI